MDELTIDGKVYVSSKKAAAISGYAKDYVGQLCREGRVDSKLVGRSWYVYEPSLMEHRFNDERKKDHPIEEKEKSISPKSSENTNIQAVFSEPVYSQEPFETIPTLEPKDEEKESPVEEAPVDEMQSAWQEWFAENGNSSGKGSKIGYEDRISSVSSPVAQKTSVYEEKVPVHIVEDVIQPKRAYKTEEREAPEAVRMNTYIPQQSIRVDRVSEIKSEGRNTKARTRRTKNTSNTIVKALLIGCILVTLSITLIATGLIEELHLSGLQKSHIFNFFQGSTVVEK